MTLITSQAINLSLRGQTQTEILNELAEMAVSLGKVSDPQTFALALAARELQGSTGFGDSVALPHTRSACVIAPGILVARTPHSVAWHASDDEPVFCWLCLMIPEQGAVADTQLLSTLCRKMVNPDFTAALKTRDERGILELILSAIS
ncbi:fructose PTS transporter subunit IIA [Rahnella selenatireducens]|uniref:fructose PTS transporter subunit IIA n=1 Tax=Rahnella selenatireducens TaxID=3389797 RepID=UPI003968804B